MLMLIAVHLSKRIHRFLACFGQTKTILFMTYTFKYLHLSEEFFLNGLTGRIQITKEKLIQKTISFMKL